MLRRLDVDWAAAGFGDDLAELAELVMRVLLSFLQYPTDPPRSDDQMRSYLQTWIVSTRVDPRS
jgi:hypothetical protein